MATEGKVKGVVDLVILLDVTGSMQPCIDAVKDNIATFVKGLSSSDANNESPIKDWRIKVCGYRDKQEDGAHWFIDNPFVREVAQVQTQLNGMIATGGGDEPESLLDALHLLATMGQSTPQDGEQTDKWRSRGTAARVIVFFTDASFKPMVSGGSVDDVIIALQTGKIVINGFVPEWSGYMDLATCERAELDPYIKIADCPSLAHLGEPGYEGLAASNAAVEALKSLSGNNDRFKKLMMQLAKSVVKSSTVEAC